MPNESKVIQVRMTGPAGLPSDRFLMFLNLNQLPTQTLAKARKLFRLMWQSRDFNETALRTTEAWLEELVGTKRLAWEAAQMSRMQRQVKVRPRDKSPEARAAKRWNEELERAEKAAQRDLSKAIKLQTYFNSERKF